MLFLKLLKDLLYSTYYNIFSHTVKWIQLKSSVRLGSKRLHTLTHLSGGSEHLHTLTPLSGPEYFFLKLWLTLDISNLVSVTVISILIIITYFSYIY